MNFKLKGSFQQFNGKISFQQSAQLKNQVILKLSPSVSTWVIHYNLPKENIVYYFSFHECM